MKAIIVTIVLFTSVVLVVIAYRTLQEASFIGAIQAIILAVTALVIWWYTEETQKIRKATFQQNDIMNDQLRVMQKNAEFQDQKERNLAQPIFQPAGYDRSIDEANVRFKNLGSFVKNMSIETIPACTSTISPNTAPTNEKFTVHLKELRSINADMELKISYDDKFSQRGSKSFLWDPEKGTRELM